MKMYSDTENELGFAKGEGPNIKVIITKKQVLLGREKKKDENKNHPVTSIITDKINEDEQFVSLGENNTFSRRHLSLYFDNEKHEWYARNLSKNPIIINKVEITKLNEPVCISPIAAISIGELQFYFCQSKEEAIIPK